MRSCSCRYCVAQRDFYAALEDETLHANERQELMADLRADMTSAGGRCRRAPLVGQPLCECCRRAIPLRDIRAFQAEAGTSSLPSCCEECAEMEVRP